jgi:hypothetical protein
MDSFGNIRALDAIVWKGTREQYAKVAEDHLRNCQFKSADLYEVQKKVWGVQRNESVGLAIN